MDTHENPSFLGVLSRLYWMMFGPFLLALFTYLVITTGNGWLTVMDFGFLAILGGLMLARWLEFRLGCPQTAEGQPAKPEHLRRYVLSVLVLGLLIWIVANILGNYLL